VSVDHRDAVIEVLAEDEASLRERVASLTADVAVYRELAQAGMSALHDLTVERDRLREQHHRLIDEFRALRAHTMRTAAAA
jgi:hypothetical protein